MPAFLTHFVFDIFAGRAAIDADRQHHGFPMAVFYVPAHSVFDVFGFKMAAFIAPPPPYFPQFRFFDFAFSFHSFYSVITTVPNKSPEPMRVGAGISAFAVHVISPAWLMRSVTESTPHGHRLASGWGGSYSHPVHNVTHERNIGQCISLGFVRIGFEQRGKVLSAANLLANTKRERNRFKASPGMVG
jgi:hypothetical protein